MKRFSTTTIRSKLPIRIALLMLVGATIAVAQEQATPASPPKLPEPETVELITKDHVLLNVKFYPGTKGKQTVPVILLHGWEGPRGDGTCRDMHSLAERLQKAGHAVIAPDLRGHGASLKRQTGDDTFLSLDRNRFGAADFRAMTLDVEAIRSFLLERHNQGELNIELLFVIGADMGSVVALNWIHYDWMAPSVPSLKQGQDVKGFVLISPTIAFKGASIKPAIENPTIRRELAALIVFGDRAPEADGVRRIHKTFERAHARRADREAPPKLFLKQLDTRLSGTKLLSTRQLKVADEILKFVDETVAPLREDHPWTKRRLL